MKMTLWRPLLALALCLGAGESYRQLVRVPEEVPIPSVIPREEPFNDVSFGQRWYDGAQYGYRRGLIRGITETQFAGELPATRAMAATMVWRMAGEPEVLGKSGFLDVEPGTYYAPAVVWGESRGLWKGYGDGTFRPREELTWSQLDLILGRYLGEETYTAAAAYPHPSTPEGEGTQPTVTRGELAETLMELCERKKNGGSLRGSGTPAPGRSDPG